MEDENLINLAGCVEMAPRIFRLVKKHKNHQKRYRSLNNNDYLLISVSLDGLSGGMSMPEVIKSEWA
jgi:hypothetical protein